jgi:hypothetical protein
MHACMHVRTPVWLGKQGSCGSLRLRTLVEPAEPFAAGTGIRMTLVSSSWGLMITTCVCTGECGSLDRFRDAA